MAAALDLSVLAIGVPLFAFVVLRGLRSVEARVPRRQRSTDAPLTDAR